MPARLLFQLDTDTVPSAFDTVVAYDGGADHVLPIPGADAETAARTVEGVVFTRGPRERQNTALFIGGTDLAAGEALLDTARKKFFGAHRVSVMLDSGGANTTAAACVALLARAVPLADKRTVVLGGTGPVGQRLAGLLARAGAEVAITGRNRARTEAAAAAIATRFDSHIDAIEAPDAAARAAAVANAAVVCNAGALGQPMLPAAAWQSAPALEAAADLNAEPPAGIEGIRPNDRDRIEGRARLFGPLGIGGLKLKLHRSCIAALFERPDRILDAEEIFARAQNLAQSAAA